MTYIGGLTVVLFPGLRRGVNLLISDLTNSYRHDGVVIWILMMTSSNGNFFRVTDRDRWIPRTKASDADALMFFFYMRPNKWLRKQWQGGWLETPLRPLWHYEMLYVDNCHSYFREIYVIDMINSVYVKQFQPQCNLHEGVICKKVWEDHFKSK